MAHPKDSGVQSQLVPHCRVVTSEVMRVTPCREWGWQRMPAMTRHAMGEDSLGCSKEGRLQSGAQAPTGQRNMRVWLLKLLLDLSSSQANLLPSPNSLSLFMSCYTYHNLPSTDNLPSPPHMPSPGGRQRLHPMKAPFTPQYLSYIAVVLTMPNAVTPKNPFPASYPPRPGNWHCCRLPLPLPLPLSLTITPHFGSKAKVPHVRRWEALAMARIWIKL